MSNESNRPIIKRVPIELGKPISSQPHSVSREPVASKSLIVGRRQIDLTTLTPEVIPNSETDIAADYAEVLAELPDSVPEVFRNQAAEAAKYFSELDDQKGNVSVEARQLEARLAHAPFVNLLFTRTGEASNAISEHLAGVVTGRRKISMGNPETSFPDWLVKKHAEPNPAVSNSTENPNLQAVQEVLMRSYGLEGRIETQGIYYDYPAQISPPKGDSIVDNFKGYIEVDAPLTALEAAFKDLAALKIHPHSSKVFDKSRFVMYWSTTFSAELAAQISNVFQSHGVPIRSFGQDSFGMDKNDQGQWASRAIRSNDASMGDGGSSIDFKQDTFDRKEFFKRYLTLCYRNWRNPAHPEKMSFFPVFEENANEQQLRTQFSDYFGKIESKGLPVTFEKSKFMSLFS